MPDRTEPVETWISHSSRAGPRGKYIRIWIIALILTGLTVLVHISSPSTIHQSEGQWIENINLHITQDVFRVRPLTTNIVRFLATHIGLTYRSAFFGLQFLLFFLLCPALYFYFNQLGYNHRFSAIGMIIFALSLPVFLAHFEPIFTWSDFWLYLMVPLSLGLAIRHKFILAALAMACALVARETAAFFIPILCAIIYRQKNGGPGESILVCLLTLALFLGGRILLVGFYFPHPEYGYQFNFDGALRTSDSIFSFIVSLGFIWVIGFYQLFQKPEVNFRYANLIRFGAVLTAIGCILSTYFYGHFRESRLFLPPAIFLVPLVLSYLNIRGSHIKELFRRYNKWINSVILITLLAISILIARLLFPKFEYRAWHDGNWIYMGIHISLMIIFLIVELTRRQLQAADK